MVASYVVTNAYEVYDDDLNLLLNANLPVGLRGHWCPVNLTLIHVGVHSAESHLTVRPSSSAQLQIKIQKQLIKSLHMHS